MARAATVAEPLARTVREGQGEEEAAGRGLLRWMRSRSRVAEEERPAPDEAMPGYSIVPTSAVLLGPEPGAAPVAPTRPAGAPDRLARLRRFAAKASAESDRAEQQKPAPAATEQTDMADRSAGTDRPVQVSFQPGVPRRPILRAAHPRESATPPRPPSERSERTEAAPADPSVFEPPTDGVLARRAQPRVRDRDAERDPARPLVGVRTTAAPRQPVLPVTDREARPTSGLSLASAIGASIAREPFGISTVTLTPADPAPPVPEGLRPHVAAAPLLARAETAGTAPTASVPAAPARPEAPPPTPKSVDIDYDEIYAQLVDRLRRDLLHEREQIGDLLGDVNW